MSRLDTEILTTLLGEIIDAGGRGTPKDNISGMLHALGRISEASRSRIDERGYLRASAEVLLRALIQILYIQHDSEKVDAVLMERLTEMLAAARAGGETEWQALGIEQRLRRMVSARAHLGRMMGSDETSSEQDGSGSKTQSAEYWRALALALAATQAATAEQAGMQPLHPASRAKLSSLINQTRLLLNGDVTPETEDLDAQHQELIVRLRGMLSSAKSA